MDANPVNTTNDDFTLDSSGGREEFGPGRTTLETECDKPGCSRRTVIRYCDHHNSSSLDPGVGSAPPVGGKPDIDFGPSRRELQRQMDRLEGKVDALLAALDIEADEE